MAKVVDSELVGVFAARMREERLRLEISQEELAHRPILIGPISAGANGVCEIRRWYLLSGLQTRWASQPGICLTLRSDSPPVETKPSIS